jgi:uncharacterized phage-like protein YoqJ
MTELETNEKELRLRRCCFTGHRPEKLRASEQEVRLALRREILRAAEEGFVTFLSGMARGVDHWAAEEVLALREAYGLRLICALPHPDFEKRWSAEAQATHRRILAAADHVVTVSSSYYAGVYQRRNCYMVDHSSLVIAAYDGTAGGTKNTVKYAEGQGVPVRNVL